MLSHTVVHNLRSRFWLLILLLGASTNALCEDKNQHPDFSGLWMPSRGATFFPNPPPYTPWAKKLRDDFLAIYDVNLDDPRRFCVHPGMPSVMAGRAPFPLEVIQRDKDITMFFEGYYQYRKIYIDGYDRPEPILGTRMGYSVGHWEGDTLVVKTTYLKERTRGADILSDQAVIDERITMEKDGEGNKMLVSKMTLTDPGAYTKKIEMMGKWRWSPDTPIMEYVCSETIYEEHLERIKAEKGIQ